MSCISICLTCTKKTTKGVKNDIKNDDSCRRWAEQVSLDAEREGLPHQLKRAIKRYDMVLSPKEERARLLKFKQALEERQAELKQRMASKYNEELDGYSAQIVAVDQEIDEIDSAEAIAFRVKHGASPKDRRGNGSDDGIDPTATRPSGSASNTEEIAHQRRKDINRLVDHVQNHQRDKVALAARRVKLKFKRAAGSLSSQDLTICAEALVKSQGYWTDITDRMTGYRWKQLAPSPLDNYHSANMMIAILSRQAYVWVGATWCPWLPVMACILQVAMFKSLKFSILNQAYILSTEPWSADETFMTFMRLALATLMVCVVPILIWINREPLCGPHAPGMIMVEDDTGTGNWVEQQEDEAMVFETVGVYLDWLQGTEAAASSHEKGAGLFYLFAASFDDKLIDLGGLLLSPPFLIIGICVMYSRYRWCLAERESFSRQLSAMEEAYRQDKAFMTSRLQHQLKHNEDDLKKEQAKFTEHSNNTVQEDLSKVSKGMQKGQAQHGKGSAKQPGGSTAAAASLHPSAEMSELNLLVELTQGVPG